MALQDTTESQKHQEMKESTTDTLSASSDRAVDMSKEDTFPPQDRGKGAWLFLAGASIIEIVAWGFPYCYGVFRAYFFTHPPFEGIANVAVAGVVSNGVLQICLPFVIYFLNYHPKQRKNIMWLGCLFCVLAPIGGAYSTTPTQLIVCLGGLYGLGAGMLFAPTMSYMAEWFVERKSLAYGFICGMGGLSGAILPPIYTVCLENYGYKATLIGWSIAVFILTFAGLMCISARVPPPENPQPTTSDFNFVRRPLFWILLTATIIQGLAHYVPSIYLPSYGEDVGLTPTQGALLVSLLNLATAFGQPLQGLLADYQKSFYIPMVFSTFGGGVEALLIWGFSRKLWSLIIFSLLYGGTSGGFAVLRPRFASAIVNHDNCHDQSLLIFGILTAVRGGAIIACGFIASAQLDESKDIVSSYGAGKWLQVIVYTGVTMIVASFGSVGKLVQRRKDVEGSDQEMETPVAEKASSKT